VIGYDAHQAQAQRDRADRAERAAMARELTAARKVIDGLPRRPCLFCGAGGCEPGCPLAAYDATVGKGGQ
jgi:hypothetical protein